MENIYKNEQKIMKRKFKIEKSTIILFVTLLIISLLSLFVGVADINLVDLFKDAEKLELFFLSRLPRLLAILATGCGMSVAGLIMQQLCTNKFVSPTTGSTIQSAQFGILLSLVFLPNFGLWGRIILSFAMALIGTRIFVWFIQKIKFKDAALVPLIGIMFGNVVGGITTFISYKFEVTQQLSSFLTGSFTHILKGNYEILYIVLPLIIISFIYANLFNIVGMGENFSKNLGVNYKFVLFLGLSISAAITASIVTIVGQISYIGLIIPNLITMFKGDKIRGNLIDTALFGAIFVLISDIIARVIIMPYELPIELIVGTLGSVIFIVLLIFKLKNRTYQFNILFKRGCAKE